MKKIFFILTLFVLTISCSDSSEKQFSEFTIQQLKRQISILEEENSILKNELAKYHNVAPSNNTTQKVGRWLDTRPGADTQLFLNKNLNSGKYYFIHKFADGSSSNEEVRVTKKNGLTRFQIIDSEHVEWFIIEKNGDLSMYGQSGKFATAQCF